MGDKLNVAVDVATGLMKEIRELRLAATKLVDAMGHDTGCNYIRNSDLASACSCGSWGESNEARGCLVRLLRNNPQPPSGTD